MEIKEFFRKGDHIEPQYVENFPRMVHTLYTGPLY